MADESELVIAGASGISASALLNATDFVKRGFGINPRMERLRDLAGPNDVIQILLPWLTWGAAALLLRDFGGKAFADQIAKRLADEVFDKAKALLSKKEPPAVPQDVMYSLKATVSSGIASGNTVILGFQVDDFRNVGIAIAEADDRAILEAMLLLTQIGPLLLADIEQLNAAAPGWYYEAKNEDCSGAIMQDTTGAATVVVRVPGSDRLKPYDTRILRYEVDGPIE
jgi:hypothetical protein